MGWDGFQDAVGGYVEEVTIRRLLVNGHEVIVRNIAHRQEQGLLSSCTAFYQGTTYSGEWLVSMPDDELSAELIRRNKEKNERQQLTNELDSLVYHKGVVTKVMKQRIAELRAILY
jgi:urease accessory protein UreH